MKSIILLLIATLILSGCVEEPESSRIDVPEVIPDKLIDNNLTYLGEFVFDDNIVFDENINLIFDSNRIIKYCDLQVSGANLIEEDETKWNFYFDYRAPTEFAVRPIIYLPVLKNIYDLNLMENNEYCFMKKSSLLKQSDKEGEQ